MHHSIRATLMVTGAAALAAVGAASARVAPALNVLEIIVGNGPFAGTYKPPASEVICLHARKEKRYTAAYKAFNANGAKMLSEVGINVSNPDDAGAKHGEVRIAFGDPDKKPTVYAVDQAPLTLTPSGKGAEIAFQGKTKDGTQFSVTAKCLDVEQM
jgi:hypothetical protein